MFRSTAIIRELVLSLAKVISILKHSAKYVVICYLAMWQHVIDVILPSV
jgi:hypothetical protein